MNLDLYSAEEELLQATNRLEDSINKLGTTINHRELAATKQQIRWLTFCQAVTWLFTWGLAIALGLYILSFFVVQAWDYFQSGTALKQLIDQWEHRKGEFLMVTGMIAFGVAFMTRLIVGQEWATEKAILSHKIDTGDFKSNFPIPHNNGEQDD